MTTSELWLMTGYAEWLKANDIPDAAEAMGFALAELLEGKGGPGTGNPNHDEKGRFASAPGGKADKAIDQRFAGIIPYIKNRVPTERAHVDHNLRERYGDKVAERAMSLYMQGLDDVEDGVDGIHSRIGGSRVAWESHIHRLLGLSANEPVIEAYRDMCMQQEMIGESIPWDYVPGKTNSHDEIMTVVGTVQDDLLAMAKQNAALHSDESKEWVKFALHEADVTSKPGEMPSQTLIEVGLMQPKMNHAALRWEWQPGDTDVDNPLSYIADERHTQRVKQLARDMVDDMIDYEQKNGQHAGGPISQEKLNSFRDSMNECIGMMTGPMVERVIGNLGAVHWHNDLNELGKEVDPHEKDSWGHIGGAWHFDVSRSDTRGFLSLDGSYPEKEAADILQRDPAFAKTQTDLYAHELGHCVDLGNVISLSPAWMNAWRSEILDVPAKRLTHYARSMPQEGFAEFFRIVLTNRAKAKDDFPECWKVLQNWGLLPR